MIKITHSFIKKNLPNRDQFSNKATAGKTLIIAGGKNLMGAGILSALAATRMGSGYTHLMTDLASYPWLKYPDFIVHPLKLTELKKREDFSIAIGPGLGVSEARKKFIRALLKYKYPNVTLDADALSLVAQMRLTSLPASWALTPHEGELARLLAVSVQAIKKERIKYLKKAQKKYGCHILLKGYQTLIISPDQEIVAVENASPSLSKAGTGDVLLGMIAALRAQHLETMQALAVASFIHGWASKQWVKKGHNLLSLRPIDLIEMISYFPDRRA